MLSCESQGEHIDKPVVGIHGQCILLFFERSPAEALLLSVLLAIAHLLNRRGLYYDESYPRTAVWMPCKPVLPAYEQAVKVR